MAIQYVIQQAILHDGNTINTHINLHSRILLEHAIDGSLAGSHGAEYGARIKNARKYLLYSSKPGHDQYCAVRIENRIHYSTTIL